MKESYVPATVQFSRNPGRTERMLLGLFDQDGELEVRSITLEPMPEFYASAMIKFSTDPARIERVLQALLEGADELGALKFPAEYLDDFYLSGVNPDGFNRLGTQRQAPLDLASETFSGIGKPGATGS